MFNICLTKRTLNKICYSLKQGSAAFCNLSARFPKKIACGLYYLVKSFRGPQLIMSFKNNCSYQ